MYLSGPDHVSGALIACTASLGCFQDSDFSHLHRVKASVMSYNLHGHAYVAAWLKLP